jgi:hypothetical protein
MNYVKQYSIRRDKCVSYYAGMLFLNLILSGAGRAKETG